MTNNTAELEAGTQSTTVQRDPNWVTFPENKPFRITKVEVHYTDNTNPYTTWRIIPNLKIENRKKRRVTDIMDEEHVHKLELCKAMKTIPIGTEFKSNEDFQFFVWGDNNKDAFFTKNYNKYFVKTCCQPSIMWVEDGYDFGLGYPGEDYVVMICTSYGLIHFYWIEAI